MKQIVLATVLAVICCQTAFASDCYFSNGRGPALLLNRDASGSFNSFNLSLGDSNEWQCKLTDTPDANFGDPATGFNLAWAAGEENRRIGSCRSSPKGPVQLRGEFSNVFDQAGDKLLGVYFAGGFFYNAGVSCGSDLPPDAVTLPPPPKTVCEEADPLRCKNLDNCTAGLQRPGLTSHAIA